MLNNKLYHGSPTQNIKEFSPQLPQSWHSKTYKNKKFFYVSNDKSYAASFTFKWNDDEITLGITGNSKPWILNVPRSLKSELDKPCSIYTFDNDGSFEEFQKMPPDWGCFQTKKPISEDKYDSVLECLRRNNVKINWIDND